MEKAQVKYSKYSFAESRPPKGFVMGFNGEVMHNSKAGLDSQGNIVKAGMPGFIQWVQTYHPEVWQEASVSPLLAGIGADAVATTPATPVAQNKIVSALTDAAAKLLPLYQQQQVFQTQLKRAQAGLAPVDVSAYTADTGYQVGLNKSTQSTLMMIAGLGVGGLLLWKLLGKR